MRPSIIAAVLFAALPFAAGAETWSGTGELGLVISRGNSKTETLNTKLGLGRESGQWNHTAFFAALRSSRDGETTASRYEFGGKSAYKLSELSYAYGSLRYENDDFAPFEYQWTASVGYGRTVIKSDTTELSFEGGPGYRRARPRDQISGDSGLPLRQDSEGDLVLRAAAHFKHRISDTTDLVNATLLEAGDENTFLQNDLGLQVRINARLALKAGFQVRHNTEADVDTRKTDTLTTLNLVYSF
jgi:putative salt-induced outer membrane protein